MRQRVAFLRTLMAGRPVLLLDEPFASLDAITRAEAQGWLAGVLAADDHTVMLVTHDVEEALYLSDQVVVMSPRPGRVTATLERARAARRRPGRRGQLRRVRRAAQAGPAAARRRQAREPAAARGAGPRSGGRGRCWRPGSWRRSWDVLADLLSIEPFLVPAPTEVAEALWEDRVAARRGRLGDAARGGAGLRCSRSSPGSALAILIHLSETARRALYPLLVASQTIPIVVLAPMLVVWFGFGIGPEAC